MDSTTKSQPKTILFRRATTEEWAESTFILLDGEPGLELGLNKIKIGDGISVWSELPYAGAEINPAEQNAVRVRKNPAPGEFDSIIGAINSIDDAEYENTYVVDVGPGDWYTDTINMKPYVHVEGTDSATHIIMNGGSNKNLINGSYGCFLSRVTLSGVTGSGYAVFYDGQGIAEVPSTVDEALIIYSVIFAKNSNLSKIDGSVNNAIANFVNVSWRNDFTEGFEVVGGNLCNVAFRNSFVVTGFYTAEYANNLFKIHGANSSLILTALNVRASGSNCIGVNAYNLAKVSVSGCFFAEMKTAVLSDAIGGPPDILIAGTIFTENIKDISIQHPETTGCFTGIASHSKIERESPGFIWNFLDIVDGAAEITNTLSVTFDTGKNTEILNAVSNRGVGLTGGGVISDAGGLYVSVSDLTGYLIDSDNLLTKAVITSIPNILLDASSNTYIYVDQNSEIATASSPPELTTTILLGRVVTTLNDILAIDLVSSPLNPVAQNFGDIFQLIFGALYEYGSKVDEGSSPLKINISNGSYWVGCNNFKPSGDGDVLFRKFYRKSSEPGGWLISSAVSDIPTDKYDDGSGTLQPITALKFVKHSLYIVGDGGNESYFFVYGQQLFDLQADAEVGHLPSVPNYFVDGIVRIASFVVLSGSSIITSVLSERPLPLTQSSATTPVTSHYELSDLINSDAGHTQFLMRNGSKNMDANLNMGGYGITNVGNVDGVDVSAHAPRHLPLGGDPITTAAPLISVSAATSNEEGTANSLARSDHQHSFDAATIVKQNIRNGTTATAPSEDVVYDALALKADKTTTISGASGLTGGGDLSSNRTISPSYGTTSNTVCQGNDTRLSDSRAPNGSAGGDLTGSYPNPTLAAAGTAGTYGSSTAVPVLTTDSKGRVTGVTNTAIAFPTSPSAAFPRLGNVAVVDAVNGNDATGAINGSPFLTIPAAIAAIGAATYVTIWVLPGSYALSAGITIPATCALRGLNTQTVRISWAASVPGGTATLLTLGENTRVEDMTLTLTSTNVTTNLVGISVPGTTMNTSKLRTITLSVNNAGVATGSTTTVTGILSSGTSSITPAEFSANFTRGVTISVFSNGRGNKRAILVSGPNAVSLRDTNFYVAPPTDPASTGSYVAAETTNNLAQAAFRSCSLSGPTTTGGYTGSDVLQTLPVARDTYGIVIGPGTDMIHRTTQGTPFALTTTSAILAYAINAQLSAAPRYLWPGTLATGGDSTPVWFRIDREMIIQGLSINMLTAPGARHQRRFHDLQECDWVGRGILHAYDCDSQRYQHDWDRLDARRDNHRRRIYRAARRPQRLWRKRHSGAGRHLLSQGQHNFKLYNHIDINELN